MISPINQFLLHHNLRIATNPCISPDFCLDWPALQEKLKNGSGLHIWELSQFRTAAGEWHLLEEASTGDCVWCLRPDEAVEAGEILQHGFGAPDGIHYFPASFANLLRLKNLILEADPDSTIFPTATPDLGSRSLGVGARFTTLHWPAVEWVMARLGLGLTANQNSIPRELVYDVDAMLEGNLDTVPFPFIGTAVPEGHQGQSVEGMSHGCILSKLKTGFHRHRLAWSFNADHQPIGGKFDQREHALVRGCLLASYITFDLSPELSSGHRASLADLPPHIIDQVRTRLASLPLEEPLSLDEASLHDLLETIWPAMAKMKRRDDLYRQAREAAFTTPIGRAYLRELSIDELPGLTTPPTTAILLALCEALDLKIHFVAPAFGFQKNCPYPDNEALRLLIRRQWAVCQAFGVSIGFHSGSGKSAKNYQVMGEETSAHLEIKTSGRYTYEMGRALHASSDPSDQALWHDWYAFTRELAIAGSFSPDHVEQSAARSFVLASLPAETENDALWHSPDALRTILTKLPPSPDHMFWFEYNFLYVLAAHGQAAKSALGDHSPAGYQQRARFYAISQAARLDYARKVAEYLIFLAEHTGLADHELCRQAGKALATCTTEAEFLAGIAP